MTLTKERMIDLVFQDTDLGKRESRQAVEATLELAKSALEAGEDLLISGFGKFQVKQKKPRKGRNPQTDQPLQLRERKVVTFKCSGVFRKKLNGDGER